MSTRREVSIEASSAMRRNRRPLLRSDSFDSEEEWKEKLRNLQESDSGVAMLFTSSHFVKKVRCMNDPLSPLLSTAFRLLIVAC